LPTPTAKTTSWPPLPDNVKGLGESSFRAPDLIIANENKDGPFVDQLYAKCDALGWLRHRNAAVQAMRWTVGGLVSATVVGGMYVWGRYKQLKPGFVAFMTDLDDEIIMFKPGHHCEANPFHDNYQEYTLDEDQISFKNRAHIIRVHPGQYILAKMNDRYTLMLPGDNHTVGVHVFEDPCFELVARVNQTDRAIQGGPINIITVPPGQVAAVRLENKPYLLFEGVHEIESAQLEFADRYETAEEKNGYKGQVMKHMAEHKGKTAFYMRSDTFLFETILHIYLRPGELRFVRVNAHASYLTEAGEYFFYSDQLESAGPYSAHQRVIHNPPLSRILVNDTEVAIVQVGRRADGQASDRDGTLQVLRNGTHVIETPNLFLGTVSLRTYPITIEGERGVTR
jgi:hypothetical protein